MRTNVLEDARSFLFVPGDRPDRFARAAGSGADQVILDLEDSVALEHKDDARRAVSDWLAEGNAGLVRVNSIATSLFDEDCAALVGHVSLTGVMVPKAEDPAELAEVARFLGHEKAVIALVETARGIGATREITRARGVVRLAFGSIDLAADLGCEDSHDALLLARSMLVLESRIAGLPAPLDGVSAELGDPDVVLEHARRARALGFGGKLCIHPQQVAAVHAAFTPSAEERAWAAAVVAAGADGGAHRVQGQMVDRPVVERALRILMLVELSSEAGTQ
ncbi:MAG: CoA ester lyase [Actinobacteria bacterium]|uniref:Unannotated protein n=1 Tax=freshwater metagenome TaxID=449393 RepID=A0A6J7KC18_9ZZZZ|nr:CoA ester lyase [Actinomycetota bacterium]